MSCRAAIPGLLVSCLTFLVLGQPAQGQMKRGALETVLKQEIDLRPFEGEVPLKAFFEVLMTKLHGANGKELRIVVFKGAFQDEDAGPDPGEVMIKFPAFPKRLQVSTALRLALSQVPTKNATFLIREGNLEITTHKAANPEALLGYPITGRFDKQPLDEVIDELSDQSGATILIDPRLGEKAQTPVSAVFKNTITLEGAVRLLAEMADLHAEVQDNVLFITGKPKVEAGEKKTELRLRGKRLDLALRDLADWSGAAIQLDPRYAPRPTPIIRKASGADTPEDTRFSLLVDPKVSATFKKGASPEAAVRILANQAGLAMVRMDGILYVTDPDNAERLGKEKAVK